MKNILTREKIDSIEIITLNNPTKLNPLSEEMLSSLQKAFDDISQNAKVKAVIVRAEGKAFCAGHDLKEMQKARAHPDGGKKYFNDLFKTCGKLMTTISGLPQPVIAEVNGVATAAGCQFVATCDLAISSPNASFGVNGVNIGLFCSTPMVALSRNISRKKTFEMLVTGDFIDSKTACSLGLVNKVVSEENLQDESFALANKIASKLSIAVKTGKEAFYKQAGMEIEDAYKYTAAVMAENMLFKETNEGINAFIERRKPNWEKN
jgi:enoyl-CoA hydratase/carnithine racemase